MSLESIGGLALHIILSKLGPNEAASVSGVSKRFRLWVSDDELLWSKFCSDDLQLDSPVDPDGNSVPSFKIAYGAWREAFHMYPWSLVIRAKRCWNRIKIWLAANFPQVLDTLHKGAKEDEIESLEMKLKVKLPLPTRVLYRFCNGQEVKVDDVSGCAPWNLVGLIGGYSFYDHLVNVFLLPLELVASETKGIIRQLGFNSRSKYIVVAESCTNEKIFFLNCSNGQLYVGTTNLLSDGEMLPCVPDSLISSVHNPKGSQVQDAMLLWMEELGRLLEHGVIKVRQDGKIRGINHFPEVLPFCQTAVSNGVKVRASAVFVPELCNLQDESQKYQLSYCIRMSLLPEGCIIDGMTFSSCQLRSRHWKIWMNDTLVDSVSGDAVIGKFPLLHQGKEEFVYESCTYLPSLPGSMEGYFTFVPGRLADPKGNPFLVHVPRFSLELPHFIF